MKALEKIHTRRVLTLLQQQLTEHLLAAQTDTDPEELKRQTLDAVNAQLDVIKQRSGLQSFSVSTPQIVASFSVRTSHEGVHVTLEDESGRLVFCRNNRGRFPYDPFKARGIHSIRTAKRFAKKQLGIMFCDIHVQPHHAIMTTKIEIGADANA